MFDFWTVGVQKKIMSKQSDINLWLEKPRVLVFMWKICDSDNLPQPKHCFRQINLTTCHQQFFRHV